ncbi:MAG: YihY/virulence factor BrkB family protein [Microlunatus sp.]|nr:YihY/virulence factor BrkB family protein [Microlunatus sp.]
MQKGFAGLPLPRPPGRFWDVVEWTILTTVRYRATGLAAEAAFFAILSLPPLIFAATGAVGFVTATISPEIVQEVRTQVLQLTAQVLTPYTVDSVIRPTIDDVLAGGRADVISIGFVIALWSGSRALNVFVSTIGIMYGFRGHRHFLLTRALSFGLYVVFIVVSVVLFPLVLLGPRIVDAALPPQLHWLGSLYWPVVLAGSCFFLASLYDLSLPRRFTICSGLPGVALALVMWVGGSWVLRYTLNRTTAGPSIYGPLAAPIALMLWLYVMSLAVLIGAALNSSIDRVRNPERTSEPEPSES